MSKTLERLGERPVLVLGAGAAVVIALGYTLSARKRSSREPQVPTFGPADDAAAAANVDGGIVNWISQGYQQFRGRTFRVRQFGEWFVMVSGSKLIDELRAVPDSVLDFKEAAFATLHGDYTMGNWRHESNLMIELVKGRLTRSIATVFPTVVEEMDAAFTDEITSKLGEDDWTPISPIGPLTKVITRMSNRLFVGLPLCRNPEYLDINIAYTFDVVKSSDKIKAWPKFLEPIVGRYYSPMPYYMVAMRRLLGPIFSERLKLMTEKVPEDEQPNDFLQWNLDAAEPFEQTLDANCERLLRLNFTAIHTTGSSFVWAMYHVAAEHAKYLPALREEIDECIKRYGWTKSSIEKMHRLDSFMKETQRMHGINAASVVRIVKRDYTFSDGTTVYPGNWVGIPSRAMHYDEDLLTGAGKFDGFRWAEEGGEPSESKRLVAISTDFIPFGVGRHMCPGRFWAAVEMKAMMAYIVTHYDLRMEKEGVVPQEMWHGYQLLPDWSARVLFRRRDRS